MVIDVAVNTRNQLKRTNNNLMSAHNKGFDPQIIEEYRSKMQETSRNYVVEDNDENSDEYVNFFFIGMYNGKEIVYDAALYTLRLHHNSELYEIAEHRAAQRVPEFRAIDYSTCSDMIGIPGSNPHPKTRH